MRTVKKIICSCDLIVITSGWQSIVPTFLLVPTVDNTRTKRDETESQNTRAKRIVIFDIE